MCSASTSAKVRSNPASRDTEKRIAEGRAGTSITSLSDEQVACPDAGEEDSAPEDLNVGPRQVAGWIREDQDVTLLDVRTPVEVGICRLPESVFVPLQELPQRLEELDREKRTVVYCHHGIRSAVGEGLDRVLDLVARQRMVAPFREREHRVTQPLIRRVVPVLAQPVAHVAQTRHG